MGNGRLQDVENVVDAVGKELVRKIIGRLAAFPCRPAGMGVGTEQKGIALASQIEADVGIAHQREKIGMTVERSDRFGHQILVLQRDHRQIQSGQRGDMSAVEAGGVDHALGDDRAFGAGHLPFARRPTLDRAHWTKAHHLGPEIASALGQREG